LRRSFSGGISIDQAHSLSEIEGWALRRDGDITELFLDPAVALGLPRVEVEPGVLAKLQNGMPIDLQAGVGEAGGLLSITCQSRLLAIYKRLGNSLQARPQAVIPGGVSGVRP
jgi:hypothetical protein